MPSNEATPRTPGEPGQRTYSRVTVRFDLIHDGAAEALTRHLLIELEVVAARWGVDVDQAWVVDVETIRPGDEESRDLPAIRPTDPETGQ